MWAVVPVAGEGSRLRSLTGGSPKCLVDVEGRPLLHYLLDRLAAVCSRVCLVVPPEAGPIREALAGHALGQRAVTVVQESPRGLGDAVARALPYVGDRALVVMGDTFFASSLAGPFGDLGLEEGGLLVERESPDPGEPAGWVLPGEDGYAHRVWKGERGSSAARRIAGAFVLEAGALGALGVSGAAGSFETVVDESIDAGARYRLLEVDGPRWNVNTPGQLAALREWLGTHAHRNTESTRS